MNNKILCSTGAIVGRDNRWNHRLVTAYGKEIDADGFELMMVKPYYDDLGTVLDDYNKSGLSFPVIHAEKDIGIFLGGEEEDEREGLRLFRLNCHAGKAVGAEKLVLHLWSGQRSDRYIERNLAVTEKLFAIAEEYGIALLCENVPCVMQDPLTHLAALRALHPHAAFVYDLRFGAFHGQNEAILASGALSDGRVAHMHVSDYVGPPHDFSSLRPIPHLGKGIIGMASLLSRIAPLYHGSVTLESPEICPDTCRYDVINADLAFMRRYLGGSDLFYSKT